MIARIVIITLAAILMLPVATLTRPGPTSHSPWTQLAVPAQAKKHKRPKQKRHHHKKRTKRTTVTRTFTSTQSLTIPNGASTDDEGPADPYPSAIAVSGLRHGTITDVNLILTDLTHSHYDDLDIMLSAPDGHRALVMSDVGDIPDVLGEDLDLILDDEAATELPDESAYLRSGSYRPTDYDKDRDSEDTFDVPAPSPDGHIVLSTFDGADPNGTWQLWVMDNGSGDHGDIGSWALEITAEVDG